jgi:hypothetical protein
MSKPKAGKSLVRGAREALAYARLFVEELTDADLEAIAKAEVPSGYDHLDAECED